MKGVKIADSKIVRRISKKGGLHRCTTCPYCGHYISIMDKHHLCGHVENIWEADGRHYVMFNQYKMSATK
jgi:hypothetical protein